MKLVTPHRISQETQDRAEAACEAVPKTMGEGMRALLNQQRASLRKGIIAASDFELDIIGRRLASVRKLQDLVDVFTKIDKRRISPPTTLNADTKALHLAELVTPPGWRGTIRLEIGKIRDAYLDEFEGVGRPAVPLSLAERRGKQPKRPAAEPEAPLPIPSRGRQEIQSDVIAVEQFLNDLDTVEAKGRAAKQTLARQAVGEFR